ncbi:MAG: ABC transporter permease [Nitrospirae bacterium]|nr:ABC transporter permease [Nitrospirota bacterium]
MKILRLAVLDLVRRPKKNGLLVFAIVISVALLTSLTIVSNSATSSILEVVSKTGHTLTIRPVITAGIDEADKSALQNLTISEVVFGKYIPESAVPQISRIYNKAIREGWERKGGLVSNPGIPVISIEPPTWAPRLYTKAVVDGHEAIVTGIDVNKEYFVRFWWNLSSGEWPADVDVKNVNTRIDAMYVMGAGGQVTVEKPRYRVDEEGKAVYDEKRRNSAGDSDQVARDFAYAHGAGDENKDVAYLGGAYASARGLKVGDTVTVESRRFRIGGVLEETNSADDYMVFIPLIIAQHMFHREGYISLLSVRAMCPNCPVGDAMVELNRNITGITAVSQLDVAGVQFDFFNMLYRFLLAVVIATIAVGIFSIFNIVAGSLYVRVREIGLLKAVGASRFQLFRIFLYEHLIIGAFAGIGGFVAGVGMAYVLNSLLGIGSVVRIVPSVLWYALALGILSSLFAIYYPAYRLSGIKITDTFRTQWEV